MSKGIGGWLRLPPIVLGLNLFILIAPFIAWEPVIQETTQKLYLVFGVMFLYALSLFSEPIRRLKDWRIGAFVIWSLISMFWHSQIWVDSFTYRYINFYLMSEGFIHIFAAVLLYKLIYEHVNKLPAIWFAILFFIGRGFLIKSLTPIFTVVICSLLYCVLNKRWLIASLIAIWVVLFTIGEWNYIALKWQARAFAWPYTIQEIIRHPFGTGFDKSLMINLIPGPNGWCFRHNDFLNVCKDLGVPALVLIGLFIKDLRIGTILGIICLGTLIVGFFQTSWYWPRTAIIFIPLWALWRIRCRQTTY